MSNHSITEPVPSASGSGPPKRRRLVIDLSQSKDADARSGKTGRRWSRLLVVLGVGLFAMAVLAAGGAYFWWQYYKTTPTYSLALLIDAAQQNDLTAVEQLIDTDRIVDSLAPQIAEKTVARYGATLNPAMRKRVEALVPALLPKVKEGVRAVLAQRVQEISELSEPKPFIVLAIGLPYFVDISTEGEETRVQAPIKDREIELVLQPAGERWKIVRVKDDVVLERVVDNIISEFPAIGGR